MVDVRSTWLSNAVIKRRLFLGHDRTVRHLDHVKVMLVSLLRRQELSRRSVKLVRSTAASCPLIKSLQMTSHVLGMGPLRYPLGLPSVFKIVQELPTLQHCTSLGQYHLHVRSGRDVIPRSKEDYLFSVQQRD